MKTHFVRDSKGALVRSEKSEKEPKTPQGTVEGFILKIKPKSDAEFAAYLAEQTRREKYSKILALQAAAKPPKRQWERTDLARDGAWGVQERKLADKLGSGFLVALIGLWGNGKTQLGTELIRRVTGNAKSARYASAVEFFMDIKSTYRSDAAQAEKEVIEQYRRPSLLVLDEAGKRAESEWENLMLFELVNRRYADMRDTLLISNQERDEFTASIGPSLASRMNETGGIIECGWPSFR